MQGLGFKPEFPCEGHCWASNPGLSQYLFLFFLTILVLEEMVVDEVDGPMAKKYRIAVIHTASDRDEEAKETRLNAAIQHRARITESIACRWLV